jgi:transcriptional accessory protein Tex/SPT6
MDTKHCESCHKPLKGRSDKKFCDDYCRNNFNNSLKSDTNNTIRNINNALRKNRRILEQLLNNDQDMVKTTRDKLLNAGFQFTYFTHLYQTQKGTTYHYIYEYGYLPLENNWYLIVKRKDETKA